jgi:hypothetical protein
MSLWRKREIKQYSDDGDQEYWEMVEAILGAIGGIAIITVIITLLLLWII